MRWHTFTLAILILSSCESSDEVTSIQGDWHITFEAFEEARSGTIQFNSDNTGLLKFYADANSEILPGNENVTLTWKITPSELILERLDNNFVLNYSIVNQSSDRIELRYLDDITIILAR
ncbi:hypothetical protein [Fulvivirga lutea]|uniref:Uncharacterized protein n=1 Tax=Fulvivirga lutea TaxID=2810512 RepID=A0A974WL61_9BACT|nr:hypothetical protein [Fulvivirga lutea]QSE98225.1 hypothetical protein JR347_03860 [Fulvivirga lutea]